MDMKRFTKFVLTLGLVSLTALFLAGCGGGEHAGHSHGADDHSHDHDHDHAAEHAAASAVEGAAGVVAVVEVPTEEQLTKAAPYTLNTCLVSGEELGSMGDPLVVVVSGQQVKLCCKDCLTELKADPAKFLAKLTP
jgi:hypothetical protein